MKLFNLIKGVFLNKGCPKGKVNSRYQKTPGNGEGIQYSLEEAIEQRLSL